MKDLECPYCEEWFEVCQDDGHLCEDDQHYQEECPSCEKKFIATVCWSASFSGYKADCLNGGEHRAYEVGIAPKPLQPRIACRDCGEILQNEIWRFND